MTSRPLVVHADDLSGAAEAAALLRTGGATLQLTAGRSAGGSGEGVTVVDLDTRQLSPAAAEARARTALGTDGEVLLTKVDSLLRGNVAAHVRALEPQHHPVVLAPAAPAAGRTVVDGVLLVRGRPLSHLSAWTREQRQAPPTVSAALDGLPTEAITIETLRRDRAVQLRAGRVAICDARTDSDLDRLVDATWDAPGVRYVGAGGLAAALGRRLRRDAGGRGQAGDRPPAHAADADVHADPDGDDSGGVLFVIGTAEPTVLEQTAALADGVDTVEVPIAAAHLLDGQDLTPYAATAAAGLGAGRAVVLRVAATAATLAATSVVSALAAVTQLVANSNSNAPLVLTGGHTARVVLDTLGVDRLAVTGEAHHGAVLLRTTDGRRVVTRPGSFGDRSSFVRIHAALRSPQPWKVTAP